MAEAKTFRAGHDKHLCYLNNIGFQISNPRDCKTVVEQGRFLCKVCGRLAAAFANQ